MKTVFLLVLLLLSCLACSQGGFDGKATITGTVTFWDELPPVLLTCG